MIGRFLRCAMLVLLCSAFAAPACADWFTEGCREFFKDIKRRNCWPEPFNCPEREAVRSPFVIMVANGWQQQNLLGDHYFELGSGQLTEAGQNKIRWIVNEAPVQHRTVYVQATMNNQETSARLDAVNQFLGRLAPEAGMPAVVQTNQAEHGWPAERVDLISRKFQSAMPVPKLPKSGDSSGDSGSK